MIKESVLPKDIKSALFVFFKNKGYHGKAVKMTKDPNEWESLLSQSLEEGNLSDAKKILKLIGRKLNNEEVEQVMSFFIGDSVDNIIEIINLWSFENERTKYLLRLFEKCLLKKWLRPAREIACLFCEGERFVLLERVFQNALNEQLDEAIFTVEFFSEKEKIEKLELILKASLDFGNLRFCKMVLDRLGRKFIEKEVKDLFISSLNKSGWSVETQEIIAEFTNEELKEELRKLFSSLPHPQTKTCISKETLEEIPGLTKDNINRREIVV